MGLRERIEEEELRHAFDQNEKLVNALYEAREQISSLKEEIDKLTAPPSTYGVYLSSNLDGTVNVLSQGRKVKVSTHPAIDVKTLTPGQQLVLTEGLNAVELPYLYADYYKEHQLTPPKGVLLYGPPGCGKTMIAKAVANNLAEKISEKRGEKIKGFFLNIKGPELLNKYVGETERKIREIFVKAKEKAADDVPVVVFFDEMDALFRTRGTGISSDVETTIVPQLLAEIDGVEGLRNVIVIGASNRQDLIDPAILRPGRLDVKIKIERPD